MDLKTARIISLGLMLGAFPLISLGTTTGQPDLWLLGIASLGLGALIPPVLRYVPLDERKDETSNDATDLGDSARVC